MFNTDRQTLYKSFSALPPKVKEWLASEEVIYLVGEITLRLGLPEEKIPTIPNLIFQLVTNDVEPLNFINELARELGINFQTAKTITEEIEKKILRPIERELNASTGLDVKTIYFGRPENAATPVKSTTSTQPQPESKSAPALKQIVPPTIPSLTQEKISPQPPLPTPTPRKLSAPTVNVGSFESESISPFMLHKEESFTAPSAEEFSKRSVSLNVKIPDSKKPEIKAIPVRIETPEPAARTAHATAVPKPQNSTPQTPPSPKTTEPLSYSTKTLANPFPTHETNQQNTGLPMKLEDSKARVVHYNGYRTPINSLGKTQVPPENTVDLRTLANNKRPTTN